MPQPRLFLQTRISCGHVQVMAHLLTPGEQEKTWPRFHLGSPSPVSEEPVLWPLPKVDCPSFASLHERSFSSVCWQAGTDERGFNSGTPEKSESLSSSCFSLSGTFGKP